MYTKIKKILFLVLVCLILFSCEKKEVVNFITTENGKKQYKNSEGIFVKDDWVELAGDKYYFDKNGYMVTDEWIQDEFFVDENGKMKKEYWYKDEDNGEYYYLGKDGKYVREKIEDIDGKKYAFDESGKWIKDRLFQIPKDKGSFKIADKNGIVIDKEGECEISDGKYFVDENGIVVCDSWKKVDGKDAYYDDTGRRIIGGYALLRKEKIGTDSEIKKWCFINNDGDKIKNDYFDVGDLNYFADEEGVLISNEWKEYEGKKYYYGSDCYLVKNQLVEDCYYVDDTGAMVTNTEIKINGKTYSFGEDGKGKVVTQPKASNSYSTSYSIGNYEINKYSNTSEKYVSNIIAFNVNETDYIGDSKNTYTSGKCYIIADKSSIRFRIKYGKLDETGSNLYVPFIKVSSEYNGWDKYRGNIIDFSSVTWGSGDKYIELSRNDAAKLLAAMYTNDKLYVSIETYYDYIDASKVYKFAIDTKGFASIYGAL